MAVETKSLIDLTSRAVDREIITASQREDLLALNLESDSANSSAPESQPLRRSLDTDENLRLVGGGNDLFVTIGVLLMLFGGFFAFQSVFTTSQTVLWTVCMIAVWVIAEFVTRQRRMKLASTVLALAFIYAAGEVLVQFIVNQYGLRIPQSPLEILGMRSELGIAGVIFFGSLILASLIYFWRFRVPILAAIIAICLTALVFQYAALYLYDGLISSQIQISSFEELMEFLRESLYMPLICGLVVFGVAVGFDLHDRDRETIWSDCAFWLHVMSAPLLVHPLFILTTGQNLVVGSIEGSASAGVMLAILIVGFTYVALAIDRRSLLVPTLAYFGVLGIAFIIYETSASTGIPPFALILLTIGALVIMFGAGWQRIRRLIVKPTLPTSVLNRLPPIKA
jgi:hypothetical protein